MSTNTRKTVAGAYTEIAAVRDDIAEIKALLTALVGAEQPANVTPAPVEPKADEPNEFVTWMRDTAEARAARKSSNKDAATWMRSKGLVPNGPAWDAVKAGERSVAKLRKMQG